MAILLLILFAALVTAVATPLTLIALRRIGHCRTNFEGRVVVNSAGFALLPAAFLPLVSGSPERVSWAGIAVAVGFSFLGGIDDRWGSRAVGGLKGHFAALARGQVTTGAVKAVGGALIGLAAAAALAGAPPSREPAG